MPKISLNFPKYARDLFILSGGERAFVLLGRDEAIRRSSDTPRTSSSDSMCRSKSATNYSESRPSSTSSGINVSAAAVAINHSGSRTDSSRQLPKGLPFSPEPNTTAMAAAPSFKKVESRGTTAKKRDHSQRAGYLLAIFRVPSW